ncbi:hypothetical protein Gotur_012438 [Gossypium turneri]
MSDFDVSVSDVYDSDFSNRIMVNLNGLNMDDIEVRELCDSDDSERLNNAHEFDSDGLNWPKFNLDNDISSPKLKVGMLFKSKDSLKEAAKRAKLRAFELIEGAHKAQYGKIYKYLLDVKTQNERATTIYYLDNRLFQRMSVCLQSYFGGYLLEAVGIDANNDIYPIAYATKVGFLAKKLKDLLWKAARANTPRDFEDLIAELKNTNQHAYGWLKEKNPTHWSRGKPILTMMETIKTKIMLFIVKKKEKAKKIKRILCPKIKKKLDVNIKDSLRCFPSHVVGDRYQVECDPSSHHVVDLVENSYSCRNWDLIGIPCMHGVGVIHLKDEFPKNYIQTWYTKQTQLAINSNFIRPIRGSKPTKVRRTESDKPQAIERLTKRGAKMKCSKCNKKGHNKRSCKEEVKRHKFDVHNQVVASNQQETTPTQKEVAPTHQQDAAPRGNLPFKRKPTTIIWMPSTQESSVTDQ